MRLMKRICVFTGSNEGLRPAYRAAAAELGELFVSRGIELVYGGGRVGLMGVLADAVLAAGGEVIGVIPAALVAREVGHARLSDLRVVGTMHERKAMMAELSDAFIAMPGGWGTLEEFFEALTWGQLGLHAKPCGLLNIDGYFDQLLAFLRHASDEHFVRAEYNRFLPVSSSSLDLLEQFERWQPPAVQKWISQSSL
jgi:uncharacterized protein (TIGR00730 family)